jgi:hypothetical protein
MRRHFAVRDGRSQAAAASRARFVVTSTFPSHTGSRFHDEKLRLEDREAMDVEMCIGQAAIVVAPEIDLQFHFRLRDAGATEHAFNACARSSPDAAAATGKIRRSQKLARFLAQDDVVVGHWCAVLPRCVASLPGDA